MSLTAVGPDASGPTVSPRTVRAAAPLAAALTTGLVAGLFARFSHAKMPGLRRVEDAAFVQAMRHVNRAVLTPWFLSAFLGGALFPPRPRPAAAEERAPGRGRSGLTPPRPAPTVGGAPQDDQLPVGGRRPGPEQEVGATPQGPAGAGRVGRVRFPPTPFRRHGPRSLEVPLLYRGAEERWTSRIP
ncbi:hypothetical protein [Streptomyces sp. GSL17-111]|uniref:hypothetical protein n=1 Tax=Streptomyces sp. GSL17-111 TaxID=3121596 RepID=UPI0030F39E1D